MNADSVMVVLNWVAWLGGLWAAWTFARILLQRGATSVAEWFAGLRVSYDTRRQLEQMAVRSSMEAEAAVKAEAAAKAEAALMGQQDDEELLLPEHMTNSVRPPQRVVFKTRPERRPPQPDAVEPQVRVARQAADEKESA